MIRRLLATVGRITERLVPDRLMLGDRVASWPDALAAAEENVEVLPPFTHRPALRINETELAKAPYIMVPPPHSDFPDCSCPARICADLDDHWPTCKARVGVIPAAGERIPDQRPAAGSDLGATDLIEAASLLHDYADRLATEWSDHRRICELANRLHYAGLERITP